MENGLQIGMGLIESTKSCPEMHICLRSWTASSSQWLSTVIISRSIFPACGMTDIEEPMIRIRLYREEANTWNQPIKKEKKEQEKRIQKKRKKGKKRIQKRRKRKRKREDTRTIADEQPSTLGVPDFRKVLGYRSP
jgi:hypothetical protein